MNDRTVRRRRLVLAALIVVSLLLVSLAFGSRGGGGSGGGPLDTVLHGASQIGKPVRDAFHWVGDTRRAKGREKELKAEVNGLRARAARNIELERQNAKLTSLTKLRGFDALQRANDPVGATVIGQNPSQWALRIRIDKGTADGVRDGMAVIGGTGGTGAGLVGRVTGAGSGSSVVTLLPDPTLNVGVRVDRSRTVASMRGAGSGTSSDLRVDYTRLRDDIKTKQIVVTSGTADNVQGLEDWAPPGIPVGTVTEIESPGDDQVVHVRPYVDMRALEGVQVLRRTADGNRAP